MLEIERKFLVKDVSFLRQTAHSSEIHQGYLFTRALKIRIRHMEGNYIFGIKGPKNVDRTTRFEWEITLPHMLGAFLFKCCGNRTITKQRHYIPLDTHTFEVDVFKDDNHGLVIAEVELFEAHEDFDKPAWLGREITRERGFSNTKCAMRPFAQRPSTYQAAWGFVSAS